MPKILMTAVTAAVIGLAGSVAQAEVIVTQKDKSFDKEQVQITAGEVIKFVNADAVGHNIHSRSTADRFDMGLQRPGMDMKRRFYRAGKIKVRCAIHPKMRLTVVVKKRPQ